MYDKIAAKEAILFAYETPPNFQISMNWKSEFKHIWIYRTLYTSVSKPHQPQRHSSFCIPSPPLELGGKKLSQEKQQIWN